jgi:hypothetical protein
MYRNASLSVIGQTRRSVVVYRTISEGGHVVVQTEWTGDFDPFAMYAWKSPSGQTFFSRPLKAKEPHVTYSPFQGQDPMEPGKWSVQLAIRGKFPLAAHFSVAGAPRLTNRAAAKATPQ